MKKSDFELVHDRETDQSYIVKYTYEEINHKEFDSDIDSPFMPEIPMSNHYPVQSFLIYLYALDKSVKFSEKFSSRW